MKAEYDSLNMEIENLRKMLQEKMERHEHYQKPWKQPINGNELHDESTAELEASIAISKKSIVKSERIWIRIRQSEDAKAYQDQYNELTKKIEDVRDQKTELLNCCRSSTSGIVRKGR